ncbi:hypothetical protein V8B97DRAFT_1238883 [Scleroderma yunnanense]
MSDLTTRLERLGADLDECDVSHSKILSRLEDSLEVISLDIHLEGLGTRWMMELVSQYRRWYRTIRSHCANDPMSHDHYIMGLLEDTEDGVSQLKSEWQRIVVVVEQMYPDPEDWDSETLVDG